MTMTAPGPEAAPAAGELVIRVRDGDDPAAWAALTARYTGLLWAIARGHGLSPADAEDVVQTTWLRLVERIDGLREPARVGAWLATVARRESLQAARGRHREPAATLDLDDAPPPFPEPGPEEISAQRERLRAVVDAFHSLPGRCRRLLRVLAAGSFGYAEVAAALEMPVGSIGPTRARCLAALDRLTGAAR